MRPVRVLLVLLASCLVALTACSSSSSTPRADSSSPSGSASVSDSPTPRPKPDPPPEVGACYLLRYDDALAPTTDRKPRSCRDPHTAVTYFVGRFARGLPVDGAQVHRVESTVCPRRFAEFVGGTPEDRRLSLLRAVWFTPTVKQADLGARWFQCVAIALRGDGSLAILERPVKDAMENDASRTHYALCATDQPGTADFEQRLCSLPHSWQALRTVPFAPGRYPGEETVRAAGQTPCQDAARAVASDPLNYQWSYAWPSQKQWQEGQTYGVCWAPA
jgi:hypothetical protein